MLEHDRAFDVEVPVEDEGRMLIVDQFLEGQLSVLDRLQTQVLPIDLHKIEGAERCRRAVTIVRIDTKMANPVEWTDGGLAIDDT